jgi:acyl-CoA hydrolase
MIGRFILSIIMAGAVLSGVSIAWPKFTTSGRPQILAQIYQSVKGTPLGAKTSQVLGVSDINADQTVDIPAIIDQMKDWAARQLQQKTAEIINRQAVNQISQGFDKLSPKEQKLLQDAICQSASDSAKK